MNLIDLRSIKKREREKEKEEEDGMKTKDKRQTANKKESQDWFSESLIRSFR